MRSHPGGGVSFFGRHMNNNWHSRKSAARTERMQQRLDAGVMATHFPEVAGISISMTYNQRGMAQALPRTVNFFPSSCALFRIDCLNKDCVDGRFDLSRVITAMIGSHRELGKGDLSCEGDGPSAGHSGIAYNVAIKYV
jgi:hypothetical protein